MRFSYCIKLKGVVLYYLFKVYIFIIAFSVFLSFSLNCQPPAKKQKIDVDQTVLSAEQMLEQLSLELESFDKSFPIEDYLEKTVQVFSCLGFYGIKDRCKTTAAERLSRFYAKSGQVLKLCELIDFAMDRSISSNISAKCVEEAMDNLGDNEITADLKIAAGKCCLKLATWSLRFIHTPYLFLLKDLNIAFDLANKYLSGSQEALDCKKIFFAKIVGFLKEKKIVPVEGRSDLFCDLSITDSQFILNICLLLYQKFPEECFKECHLGLAGVVGDLFGQMCNLNEQYILSSLGLLKEVLERYGEIDECRRFIKIAGDCFAILTKKTLAGWYQELRIFREVSIDSADYLNNYIQKAVCFYLDAGQQNDAEAFLFSVLEMVLKTYDSFRKKTYSTSVFSYARIIKSVVRHLNELGLAKDFANISTLNKCQTSVKELKVNILNVFRLVQKDGLVGLASQRLELGLPQDILREVFTWIMIEDPVKSAED